MYVQYAESSVLLPRLASLHSSSVPMWVSISCLTIEMLDIQVFGGSVSVFTNLLSASIAVCWLRFDRFCASPGSASVVPVTEEILADEEAWSSWCHAGLPDPNVSTSRWQCWLTDQELHCTLISTRAQSRQILLRSSLMSSSGRTPLAELPGEQKELHLPANSVVRSLIALPVKDSP